MTKEIAARKVAEVLARVQRVRDLLPSTVAEFKAGRTEAEALILNLYLALQASSDLAMHIVADRGLGVPGTTRDAFALLGSNGIVRLELAERLAAAVGLRNRIAHQYGTLDLELVYRAARDDLGDLDSLAAASATCFGL